MRKILEKILFLFITMVVIAYAQPASAQLQIVDLGTMFGGMNSGANDINDFDQILGGSVNSTGLRHAVINQIQRFY